MNRISSVLLALSLLSTASLTFAMEPMDKNGAMGKDTMSKDAMKKEPMKKEGAMMKAQPKKMKKQTGKTEQSDIIKNDDGMSMEPKK